MVQDEVDIFHRAVLAFICGHMDAKARQLS